MHAVVRADVEEADDIRVVQGCDCSCLALEARDELGGAAFEHLYGNAAVEACVAGAVDIAHSAGAECPDDLVWAEPGSCRQGKRASVVLLSRSSASARCRWNLEKICRNVTRGQQALELVL